KASDPQRTQTSVARLRWHPWSLLTTTSPHTGPHDIAVIAFFAFNAAVIIAVVADAVQYKAFAFAAVVVGLAGKRIERQRRLRVLSQCFERIGIGAMFLLPRA